MRMIFLPLAVLALTACENKNGPYPMPSGYTYHGDEYKAPPRPTARDIGYEYSGEKNEEVMALWRDVVHDMVGKLETQTSLAPQPVYVETMPGDSAFNASFDYALRAELKERGYELVGFKGNSLRLRYEAFLPVDEQLRQATRYNDDPDIIKLPENKDAQSAFVLAISALKDGVLLGDVRGLYDMPAYGYESGLGRAPVDAGAHRE